MKYAVIKSIEFPVYGPKEVSRYTILEVDREDEIISSNGHSVVFELSKKEDLLKLPHIYGWRWFEKYDCRSLKTLYSVEIRFHGPVESIEYFDDRDSAECYVKMTIGNV